MAEIKKGGLLEDNRNKKDQSKDYLHNEINFGSASGWLSKAEALKVVDKYEKLNQLFTSSCGAHALALTLGIDNDIEGEGYVKLAPAMPYRLRVNYPDEGMYAYDIGDLGVNVASCLYETLPTPNTERAINKVVVTDAMRKEAETYKAKKYIFINDPTINQIKNITNANKPMMVSIFATTEEWEKEFPTVDKEYTRDEVEVHHLVTVLPNSSYTHYGKKYLIIQDSAHFGGKTIRHLSEEFVLKRVRYGLYFLNLPNPTPSKEKSISFNFNFTQNLKVGMENNDVLLLQKALQDLGFFTYHTCTGYFGGITLKAVKDFQEYYANDVLKIFGLSSGTGYVGWSTRRKLHSLMKN